MKYKKYLIVAATLVMIGVASVGPAMAYFTDSHKATGTVAVNLGDTNLTPNESVEDMVKTIQITNSGDYDVFIRVKAIYGSTVTVTQSSGDKWTLNDDGYYYYSDIVEAGGTTEALQLEITPPSDTSQESFNVIIAEEATRANYASDGTATADWSLAIKTNEVISNSDGTDDTTTSNSEEGDE